MRATTHPCVEHAPNGHTMCKLVQRTQRYVLLPEPPAPLSCVPARTAPPLSSAALKVLRMSRAYAGQYVANYSMAGRLSDLGASPDNSGCEGASAGLLDFLLGGGRVVPGVSSGSHLDVASAVQGACKYFQWGCVRVRTMRVRAHVDSGLHLRPHDDSHICGWHCGVRCVSKCF